MIRRYIKEFYRFIKHIVKNKKLIIELSINDFQEQYLGSYLGAAWALIRPLLFIGVMWFVFSVGFKARPIEDGTPYILWLLCGMIPWFLFADALAKSTNAVVGNAFLVKKVAFRVSILPLIKILSSLYIHLIFVAILLTFFLFYGFKPTIYWLQIPYFILCTVALLLGLGWLTSSVRVFVKDIGEVIGIVIQFGFWLTPIFWSIDNVPEKYQPIIKLNPMFYIIDGYRNALIYHKWFWEEMGLTVYLLSVLIIVLMGGAIVFKRLRPHFGDVL